VAGLFPLDSEAQDVAIDTCQSLPVRRWGCCGRAALTVDTCQRLAATWPSGRPSLAANAAGGVGLDTHAGDGQIGLVRSRWGDSVGRRNLWKS